MTLNDTGLPLPGRELDLEVARILGYEIVSRHRDATQETYILDCGVPGTNLWIIGPGMVAPKKWTPSTTHAFFQVMEAAGGRFITHDTGSKLYVSWQDTSRLIADGGNGHWGSYSVWVAWADYPSREAAYAHAVCCCVYLWKTQQ